MASLTRNSSLSCVKIGNYFGAIKQHIDRQDKGDCFYFIADYHALTTLKEAEERECNCKGGGSGSGQGKKQGKGGEGDSQAKGEGQGQGGRSGGGSKGIDSDAVKRLHRGGPQSPWSHLRDKDRDPVYSAIKEKFPARYQQLIEQYYKSFNDETEG